MAITTRTVTEAVCDACREEIDTSQNHVNASVYGAAFHPQCWEKIGGPVVARVLGLDEIETCRGDRRLGRAWAPRPVS